MNSFFLCRDKCSPVDGDRVRANPGSLPQVDTGQTQPMYQEKNPEEAVSL